ncbi:MAG: SIR2 family protein [Gammaproteobacteria bacterium]
MMFEITERVLLGEGVFRHSDGSWHLGTAPSPPLAWDTKERLGPIRRFLKRLKTEVDGYYDPERHSATYEDLHFMASQVHDALNREYENPAVRALIERLQSESELFDPEPDASVGRNWSLLDLSREATEYVHDVATALLGPPTRLDVLPFVVDACRDLPGSDLTIATLNHDTLIERILKHVGIEFSDGFGPAQPGVRYFDPALLDASEELRLLKVHGSVNWFRLRPDEGDWTEDKVGIFETRDFYHSTRPDGRPQIPEERPTILIGTFNKQIRYTDWFFSEIFSRFQQALKRVDTVVICGYGFGDKGINSQITQWIPMSEAHRVVVIHPRPDSVTSEARGAIQRAFHYLQSNGRLHLIPRPAHEAAWRLVLEGCGA